MRNPKVSIIVPVYDTDLHIFKRCIQSVLDQTYSNWELIIIDDGSKEECATVIDDYLSKDERIVVYHQVNAGVSVARNKGLELAKGEYITFVDSDDEILPGFLKRYVDIAEKYSLDMVVGGMHRVYVDGHSLELKASLFSSECYVVRSTELLIEKVLTDRISGIPELPSAMCSACGKLLRIDLAKQVAFPIGILIGEDLLYYLHLMTLLKKVGFVKESLYQYYQFQNSAVHRHRKDTIEQYEKFLGLCKLFVNKQVPGRIDDYYTCVILRYGYIVNGSRDRVKIVFLRSLAERPIFKEAVSNINPQNTSMRYRHRLLVCLLRNHCWSLVYLLFLINNYKRRLTGKEV